MKIYGGEAEELLFKSSPCASVKQPEWRIIDLEEATFGTGKKTKVQSRDRGMSGVTW